MPWVIAMKRKGSNEWKQFSEIAYNTESEARFAFRRMKATRDFRIMERFHGTQFDVMQVKNDVRSMFGFSGVPMPRRFRRGGMF